MNFDELTRAWQAQDTGRTVEVDVDALTRLVRGEQRLWDGVIARRDVVEVAAICVAAAVLLTFAVISSFLSLYVAAGTPLFTGGFIIADRMLQSRRRPRPSQSVKAFVEQSIDKVDHQVWLLRNVLWWYIIPLSIGPLVFLGHLLYVLATDVGFGEPTGLRWILFVIGVILLEIVMSLGVYFINQKSVRATLLPRKRELEDVLRMFAQFGREDTI
jgi:hypothetical protein